MKRHSWVVSAIFLAISLGAALWFYPALPGEAPIHWNAAGHADGWAPRLWAAAIWPLLIFGLAVLTAVLPRISPRKFEMESFARVYEFIMLVMQGTMLVMGVGVLLAGTGHEVPIGLIVTVAVGVLLLVIGNYMGKFRKNFFIGIRTPWALASNAVWERTHRFGGWLLAIAGVAWIVGALAHVPMNWLIGVVLAAALLSCVYSYVVYRRLEGRRVAH